jgi:cytochrome c oxidase subunit 4
MSDPNTPPDQPKATVKYDLDSPGTILFVYVAVLALTGLTLAVSMAGLGKYTLFAQLAIGGVQATLVSLYWMHLKKSDKVIGLTALAAIFWLGIAFVLILADFFTRHRFTP